MLSFGIQHVSQEGNETPFQISLITVICCIRMLALPTYGNEDDDIDNVREDSSMEAPVVLKGLRGFHQVRKKEAEYINTIYREEGYEPTDKGLLELNKNRRFLHTVLYRNALGEYLGVYYDISTAIAVLRKTKPLKYKELLESLKYGARSTDILDW